MGNLGRIGFPGGMGILGGGGGLCGLCFFIHLFYPRIVGLNSESVCSRQLLLRLLRFLLLFQQLPAAHEQQGTGSSCCYPAANDDPPCTFVHAPLNVVPQPFGHVRFVFGQSLAQLFGPVLLLHLWWVLLYLLIIFFSIFLAWKNCDAELFSRMPNRLAISLWLFCSKTKSVNTVL